MPTNTLAELQHLIGAFFNAVSFDPDGSPDYARIRELFIPGGLLIRNIGETPEVTDAEAFIAARETLYATGTLTAFVERELAEITEVFGGVAHRFSTYEKHGTQAGVSTSAMGVITTQFVRTSAGWLMASMAWDDARPGQEVPARYRPG